MRHARTLLDGRSALICQHCQEPIPLELGFTAYTCGHVACQRCEPWSGPPVPSSSCWSCLL
jgi:hypothetical protein